MQLLRLDAFLMNLDDAKLSTLDEDEFASLRCQIFSPSVALRVNFGESKKKMIPHPVLTLDDKCDNFPPLDHHRPFGTSSSSSSTTV